MSLPEVRSPDHFDIDRSRQTLTGTWRLVSWETHHANGTVSRPFGDRAVGYLVYTTDGHVLVQGTRPGPRALTGGDIFGLSGDMRWRAIQGLGYFAYGGTYEVKDVVVVHHVELALFPAETTERRRRIEWDQDRLVLTTLPSIADGDSQEDRLTWQRVPI